MSDEMTEQNKDLSKIGNDLAAGSSVEDRAAQKNPREEERFTEVNQAMALTQGSLTEKDITLRGVFSLAVHFLTGSDAEAKRKAGKSMDDVLLMSLLNDMRERLDELDQALAAREQILKAKYGEDFVQGMVDTYLTDEEKAGIETEEDALEALAKRFLNPDGTIKDEYKNSEEAKYVRDWKEAQKLRPIVEEYESKQTYTAEDHRKVTAVAQSVGLAGQENMYTQSSNADMKDSVEQVMDANRSNDEVQTSSTAFSFSKPI